MERRVSSWQNNDSALKSCVGSLQSTNHALTKAMNTLGSTISDYPRMVQIFNHERAYQLVNVTEIKSAQYAIASEIEPQIKELIAMAETGLSKKQAEVDVLQQRKRAAQAQHEEEAELQRLEARLAAVKAEKDQLLVESEQLERQLLRQKS